MSASKHTQGLPKSDGTTSTNYGPTFEISSTAIFVLRCCKLDKNFTVWINHTPYEPWDDIVAKIDGKIVCVQLKHNEKLDKGKLDVCMNKRESILEKHEYEKDDIIFVYFATTPDDGIRLKYSPVPIVPDLLGMLITNDAGVYYDQNKDGGETYFCMGQHNVSAEDSDVKKSLLEYIGQQYLTEDHVKDIQTKFLDYLRKRYLRLLKGSDPLTKDEVCKQLGYAMLNKFKIEYKPDEQKIDVSNNLIEIIDESSIVILNHKRVSTFKDHVWQHLMLYLEDKIAKKHLKQTKLDDLWIDGKLHMPIFSPNKDTDKVIWRALAIANFEPKVLILRSKLFTIRQGQTVITLLQNLKVSSKMLNIRSGEEKETFKYSIVGLDNLKKNRNLKLHHDTFCLITKGNSKLDNNFPGYLVEAHDEYNYVNDINTVGNEETAALFSAIRIKDIDVNIIEQIIDFGANVNINILGGHKPISYAVQENRPDIVELLLRKNANPDPADKYGMRPLFYACLENKTKIVELLVKYNADRTASDVNGVTPLFMAYKVKNFEIIRILLFGHSRPAAANTQGNHILHVAAVDGNTECLKCIVDLCPNINIFMTGDINGKSPIDLAQEGGFQEFLDDLKQALNSSNK